MAGPSAALHPAFTDAINRRDFVVLAYPAAALRLPRLIERFRVEVRLFTPSRELRDDWARMLAGAAT